MNKYKIAGLVMAVVLLIAALIFKFAGGETAAVVSLPLLTIGLWALIAVDTIGYKKLKLTGIQKNIELARLVGGYIIAVLVSAGTVIYLIFR